LRSVASGPPSSSTARSQAASSRDTAAPAAATTAPSFERNSRSRVASRTRLDNPLRHVPGEPIGGDAHLLERVAVAHRHAPILGGLSVDGDAERRAGLV